MVTFVGEKEGILKRVFCSHRMISSLSLVYRHIGVGACLEIKHQYVLRLERGFFDVGKAQVLITWL